jgi:hypothetical protein
MLWWWYDCGCRLHVIRGGELGFKIKKISSLFIVYISRLTIKYVDCWVRPPSTQACRSLFPLPPGRGGYSSPRFRDEKITKTTKTRPLSATINLVDFVDVAVPLLRLWPHISMTQHRRNFSSRNCNRCFAAHSMPHIVAHATTMTTRRPHPSFPPHDE